MGPRPLKNVLAGDIVSTANMLCGGQRVLGMGRLVAVLHVEKTAERVTIYARGGHEYSGPPNETITVF